MTNKKEHRLVARATGEQVRAIWAAAELEGILPSEFIRRSAVDEAHRVIERYTRISVSMETADKMMAALDRASD